MARVSQTRTKLSRVEGLDNLDRKLNKLVEGVVQSEKAKRVNYSAGLEARRIIQQNAPPNKGISSQKGWTPIRNSIDIIQSGMPVYVKQNRNKNPAGLWLEYGTKNRRWKNGKSTGEIRATNWWSIGRNKSRSAVRKILRAGYQSLVEDVARAR